MLRNTRREVSKKNEKILIIIKVTQNLMLWRVKITTIKEVLFCCDPKCMICDIEVPDNIQLIPRMFTLCRKYTLIQICLWSFKLLTRKFNGLALLVKDPPQVQIWTHCNESACPLVFRTKEVLWAWMDNIWVAIAWMHIVLIIWSYFV